MKYCSYCGAALPGDAVFFCAECGRDLPSAAKARRVNTKTPGRTKTAGKISTEAHTKNKRNSGRKSGKSAKPAGKPFLNGRKPFLDWLGKPRRHRSNRPEPERKPKPSPRDEGYDGYFDDVKPIDDGRIHERVSPELIIRIAMLAAGALIIVILAVILMYVL